MRAPEKKARGELLHRELRSYGICDDKPSPSRGGLGGDGSLVRNTIPSRVAKLGILPRQATLSFASCFGRSSVHEPSARKRTDSPLLKGEELLARLDLDLARRGFRLLRDRDFQYAVLALGGDAFRIGAVGQREAAMEHAARTLDARVVALVHRALALALATDGEDALVHVHFDVLGIDAGDVRLDHELLGFLADIHARRPLAGDHAGLVVVVFVIGEKAVDHALELARILTAPTVTADVIHVMAPLLLCLGRCGPHGRIDEDARPKFKAASRAGRRYDGGSATF